MTVALDILHNTSVSAQVAVALGLLVLTGLVWHVLFSPLRIFPGPLLAKVTDLWRAAYVYRGRIDLKHLELHRQYGQVVRIGPSCLSVADPNLIRMIYTTRNPWKKSNMYKPGDTLSDGHRIANVFNTQDEEWHKQQIAPIRSMWGMTKVLEYEPLFDETLMKLVDKFTAKYVDTGKVCHIDEWMGYFAWDTAANMSFGREYGFLDEEKDVEGLIEDSYIGNLYFAPATQIPWIDEFLDKNPLIRLGPRPLLKGVTYTANIVKEYITHRPKGQAPQKSIPYVLEKYWQMRQSDDSIDDQRLVHWMLPPILAGGDTTAASMRAVIYNLAKSPSARQKLFKELDDAQLSVPAQWKDIRSLAYLDAVIRESMRVNPGISMIFERVVPDEGFTLPDARFVPGGTIMGVNPFVTNRDKGIFGEDVDLFCPERWLQADGESQETFSRRLRRMRETCDFVFGGGGRICLGRNMAMLETFKLIATLYSQFDIQLLDPAHKWRYVEAWFVYQMDIPVVISRRKR